MNNPIRLSLLSLAVLTSSTAHADTATPPPGVDVPSFATMDRVDRRSHADVSLATSFFDGEDPDFNTRLDLHAQYVTPQGTGGYASLPMSYISDGDDSEGAVGNFELGGIHVINQGPTDIVLRGGLMLATASDDFESYIVNFATVGGRITDYVAVFPDTTWLRLGGSAIHRAGNLFARADLGLDVALDKPDGASIDPLVRVNVGAGVAQGDLAFMAEFATIGTTGDVEEDEDRFIHTFAVSLRARAGTVSPFAAIVVPMNMDGGFIDVSFVATAGVQIPIGK